MGGLLKIDDTLFRDRGRAVDLNLSTKNGSYTAGSETLNRPNDAAYYGTILVCASGNFITQTYIPNYENLNKYGYFSRVSTDNGSNWEQWRYIGS